MAARAEPIGVVLAGGRGRRMGGQKATVVLSGQPLIAYPLQALARTVADVRIVAKPDTQLPSLAGVTVWIEPESPRHPLFGIVHALALAEGRSVLVCACDLPLVTPALLRALHRQDPGEAPAVLASAGSEVQPLLGCYRPAALEPLRALSVESQIPMRAAAEAIGAYRLEVADRDELFNVNSPVQLLQAAEMLERRRRRPRDRSPNRR
jgi:molybdopterin-guanine dinucleotide biosynthesis protein A